MWKMDEVVFKGHGDILVLEGCAGRPFPQSDETAVCVPIRGMTSDVAGIVSAISSW